MGSLAHGRRFPRPQTHVPHNTIEASSSWYHRIAPWPLNARPLRHNHRGAGGLARGKNSASRPFNSLSPRLSPHSLSSQTAPVSSAASTPLPTHGAGSRHEGLRQPLRAPPASHCHPRGVPIPLLLHSHSRPRPCNPGSRCSPQPQPAGSGRGRATAHPAPWRPLSLPRLLPTAPQRLPTAAAPQRLLRAGVPSPPPVRRPAAWALHAAAPGGGAAARGARPRSGRVLRGLPGGHVLLLLRRDVRRCVLRHPLLLLPVKGTWCIAGNAHIPAPGLVFLLELYLFQALA